MELPTLKIGNLTARYPFVQGGMAVRVSTGPLAAAVAEAGGVGTIAGTGMTPDELRGEIRYARSKTKGIMGVNVLFAVRQFAEDIVLVESPVGMTGRAIRNRFTEALARGELVQDVSCDDCLKRCTHAYCILDALDRSRKGDVDHGVVFSGTSATRIKDILPVREIIAQLVAGATKRLREIQPS